MRSFCLQIIFSTLHSTLPHNFSKDKLLDLIERFVQTECSLYTACNNSHAFFCISETVKLVMYDCQKVYEALNFHLVNIYVRFGSEIYR